MTMSLWSPTTPAICINLNIGNRISVHNIMDHRLANRKIRNHGKVI